MQLTFQHPHFSLRTKQVHLTIGDETSTPATDGPKQIFLHFLRQKDETPLEYFGNERHIHLAQPGEYELSGVFILSYFTADHSQLAYAIIGEGQRICFLPALSSSLPATLSDQIGNIATLVLPLTPFWLEQNGKAYKELIERLEPSTVIAVDLGQADQTSSPLIVQYQQMIGQKEPVFAAEIDLGQLKGNPEKIESLFFA